MFLHGSRSCSAENGCSKYQETRFLDAVYFSNIIQYISTWYLRKCHCNDEKLLCSQRRLASCARGSFQTVPSWLNEQFPAKFSCFERSSLTFACYDFSVVRSIDELREYKTKMQKLEKLIKPRNVSFKPTLEILCQASCLIHLSRYSYSLTLEIRNISFNVS